MRILSEPSSFTTANFIRILDTEQTFVSHEVNVLGKRFNIFHALQRKCHF